MAGSTVSDFVRQRTWQVSDAPFNPYKLSHSETIYTIGNGYMGLRGTFEEGYPGEMVSTLVHGIFNHAPGELVPDLVNLPNPLPIVIEVDGEAFHMDKGRILGFRRTLDLRTATLRREVLWRNSRGMIVRIAFERFASLEIEHVLVQRVQVRALSGDCTIGVRATIDGTQTNFGVQHWSSLETGHEHDNVCYVTGRTNQSGYGVVVMSLLDTEPGATCTRLTHAQRPGTAVEFAVKKEQQVTIDKYTVIVTTRDSDEPLEAARKHLTTAHNLGYEQLRRAHNAEWEKYWHDSDVEIEGDEVAQRAVRFAMYHTLIAAPRHDERVSIGAKTLSGPGYKGHVFWDTELFMLPPLTVTQPRLARNLLMYRYHNLQGARNKAKKAGYEGAMFPWESTDTGEETTPQWTNPDEHGNRIRIWTGDTEQHISTDIAYAVMQYWGWTGEDDWFARYGAEIVLDTAVFWGSRAEYNAAKDRYEIRRQIGPDEYHENIDNSAFTNSMVRWHLKTALRVRDWLRKYDAAAAEALLAQLAITDERAAKWQTIIDKMYIPRDPQRGILEQFDNFFKLEPLDLSHWQPRVANMDWILGHELTQRTMIIKQADIVMLMALLGDEFGSMEERRRNWDFYAPIVDHGSSLSPSTHAWIAARLGLIDDAYKLFIYAASIDLEDLKGNVRDGIHAAACGGVWEAVAFGFGGLALDGATFKTDPKLPAHWRSLKFRIYHHGQQHTIELTG